MNHTGRVRTDSRRSVTAIEAVTSSGFDGLRVDHEYRFEPLCPLSRTQVFFSTMPQVAVHGPGQCDRREVDQLRAS
jgi:hypothetical protein